MKQLAFSFSLLFSVLGLCWGANHVWQTLQEEVPPTIQGRLLQTARSLDNFSLLDQYGRRFTQSDFEGKWTVLAYGFTDCPDICPMLLQRLVQLKQKLTKHRQYHNLNVVFYTIDPIHDTSERLREYLSFFDKEFIGLTWQLGDQTDHIAFEKSLGIKSAITPDANSAKGYRVSHGVMMYLINPQGALQAVFSPEESRQGFKSFNVDTLEKDYLTLRKYFDA